MKRRLSVKAILSSHVPAFFRKHALLLASVVVILGGLVVGSCWFLLSPAESEPPAIPLDGVEKPVADAITAARDRVVEQPRSAEAWGQLGKVLLAHRFNEQAAHCFARAEKLEGTQPRWPYYRGLLAANEDDRLALAHFRRAAELGDRYDPGVLSTRLRLAELLVEQGQTEEAEAQLRVVAGKDPNNPRLLFNWGLLALARDDLDTAIDSLSRLTKHPSARKKACAQLAILYRRREDEAKAAELTRMAAQLPPDSSWEDRYAEEYRKIQINSQERLRQARALEAEGRIGEVVALLDGISKDTDSEQARLELGTNLIKLGQYGEAEKALRNTLAHNPDKVQAHYHLAVVLFIQAIQAAGTGPGVPEVALAKYRESAEHARQAIARKPDHALAHMYLGRALLALGQGEEGLKELRAAIACKPDEARVHFFLAEALADARQNEEGLRHLELATRLAGKGAALPEDAAVQRIREKLTKPK
jgi:tetratricopeptide (TPR) repeat protein